MNMLLIKKSNAEVLINLDNVTEIWNYEYEDGQQLEIYFGKESATLYGTNAKEAWEAIKSRTGDAS